MRRQQIKVWASSKSIPCTELGVSRGNSTHRIKQRINPRVCLPHNQINREKNRKKTLMLFDGEVTSLSGPKRNMAQSYTEHKDITYENARERLRILKNRVTRFHIRFFCLIQFKLSP